MKNFVEQMIRQFKPNEKQEGRKKKIHQKSCRSLNQILITNTIKRECPHA